MLALGSAGVRQGWEACGPAAGSARSSPQWQVFRPASEGGPVKRRTDSRKSSAAPPHLPQQVLPLHPQV